MLREFYITCRIKLRSHQSLQSLPWFYLLCMIEFSSLIVTVSLCPWRKGRGFVCSVSPPPLPVAMASIAPTACSPGWFSPPRSSNAGLRLPSQSFLPLSMAWRLQLPPVTNPVSFKNTFPEIKLTFCCILCTYQILTKCLSVRYFGLQFPSMSYAWTLFSLKEREKQRERKRSSTLWFTLQWPQCPEMGQSETRT